MKISSTAFPLSDFHFTLWSWRNEAAEVGYKQKFCLVWMEMIRGYDSWDWSIPVGRMCGPFLLTDGEGRFLKLLSFF